VSGRRFTRLSLAAERSDKLARAADQRPTAPRIAPRPPASAQTGS